MNKKAVDHERRLFFNLYFCFVCLVFFLNKIFILLQKEHIERKQNIFMQTSTCSYTDLSVKLFDEFKKNLSSRNFTPLQH